MIKKLSLFALENYQLIASVLLTLVVVNMCRPKDRTIVTQSKPKVITQRVETAKQDIHHHTKQVVSLKGVISSMDELRDQLMAELEEVKGKRDTARIVVTQDSVIRVLVTQSSVKDSVIRHQDAIISKQGYVIASQDTLLHLSADELRRVKRQRNWSFVANGALVGLLILK